MAGRASRAEGARCAPAQPRISRRGCLAVGAGAWVHALGAAPGLLPLVCRGQAVDHEHDHEHQHEHGPGEHAGRPDLPERLQLLREAESALARGDAAGAEALLDQASRLAHSADTELALVRCNMQAGQYRRAIGFGAHAAGAHRRELPAGNALYLWLLQAGGQPAAARQLLDLEMSRAPGEPALMEADRQLRRPWPLARGLLLQSPLRVAPYAWGAAVPADAGVLGTGVLGGDGRHAWVPASACPDPSRPLWLRNGLGQTVPARRVDPGEPGEPASPDGLVRLRLAAALPRPAWQAAPQEPFGGTPASVLEYAIDGQAEAAWPLMFPGFMGRLLARPGPRPLGIELPAGPRGGPVIDKHGRLAGIALRGPQGQDEFISVTALAAAPVAAGGTDTAPAMTGWPVGEAIGPGAPAAALDEVYERALPGCLQLLG